MKLYQKVISLYGSNSEFKCHDYSNIIDVDVYKGAYDNYWCRVYYTTPNIEAEENKTVQLLCLHTDNFTDVDKEEEAKSLNDNYRFLKSIVLGEGMVKNRLFIFIREELSVAENRDVNLENIIL